MSLALDEGESGRPLVKCKTLRYYVFGLLSLEIGLQFSQLRLRFQVREGIFSVALRAAVCWLTRAASEAETFRQLEFLLFAFSVLAFVYGHHEQSL